MLKISLLCILTFKAKVYLFSTALLITYKYRTQEDESIAITKKNLIFSTEFKDSLNPFQSQKNRLLRN